MVCLEVEMRAEQKESLLVVEMAAVKDGLMVGWWAEWKVVTKVGQ